MRSSLLLINCHDNRVGTSAEATITMANYQQQFVLCSVLTAQTRDLEMHAGQPDAKNPGKEQEATSGAHS